MKPLPTEPAPTPEPTAEQVATSTDQDELRAWWKSSSPERKKHIEDRVFELKAADSPDTLPTEPTEGSAS